MMSIKFTEPGFLFMVCLLTAAGSLYVLWKLQPKRFFFYFRLVMLALLLFAFLEPSMVKYSSDTRPTVAVVVDASKSMFMTGRYAGALKSFKENSDRLKNRFKLKYYIFSSSAKEVGGFDNNRSIKPGPSTDISRSLWEVKRENSDKLSGMILYSDGQHNAEPFSGNWIEELSVPVFPVMLKDSGDIKDVAVSSVRVGDFAFKKMPLKITVELIATGFRSKTVQVNIRNANAKGNIVASGAVNIASNDETREIALQFTPQESGKFSYVVEAVPMKGEITTLNNYRKFDIEVVHDKIRVLYLSGQPGFEYSFLRNVLKNDSLIELVSFVILRNNNNLTLVSDQDLSLIPFPVADIFTKDLYDFDILILENFTFRGYGFYPPYFENIKNWVTQRSGGLLVIGGENSFGRGGWSQNPVSDILPVSFDNDTKAEQGEFRPLAVMPEHEIMAVDEDTQKNIEAWKEIPELDGCQQLRIKNGAQLLLKHPLNWAVLSCWERGRGRVAVTGSNTTWRWSLNSKNPDTYNLFWKNIIRWLSRSKGPAGISVFFDRPSYFAGQVFSLKLRSGTENMSRKKIELSMRDPMGEKRFMSVSKSGSDEYMVSGKFAYPGRYSFEVRSGAKLLSSEYIEVALSFVREEMNLNVDTNLLREIAARSKGIVLERDGDMSETLKDKISNRGEKDTREKIPVSNNKYFMLLVIGWFVAELVIRKFNGLL
jgi:uncharacterized membrane protein